MYFLNIEHISAKLISDDLIPNLKPKPKLTENTRTQYPRQHKLTQHNSLHFLPSHIILSIESDGDSTNIQ